MLNRVVIQGRITRDIELKRTNAGIAVCTFSIANDDDYKREDGSKTTSFFDVVAWRGTAEFASKYLGKGRNVVVEGKLATHDYTDKSGNQRKSYEVIAEHIYFADSKPTDQEGYTAGAEIREEEDDGCLPF